MDNEKKLNVGLFIDTFFPMVDGVIMVVDNYARRLSEFCNVTVFTLRPRGYKKCNRTYPYKVVQCGKLIVPFLDYDLPMPKLDGKFMKALKEAKLDIVHIHSPFTVGKVGIEYAKKHNIPCIASLHSQFKRDFFRATKSKTLTKILLKGIIKKFDACDECYATNENHAALFYDEYGLGHLPKVQRNGTDMLPIKDLEAAYETVNAKFDIPSSVPLFLFVGRINKLKNIYFLLDALCLVKTDFRMMFVGDGHDLSDFKSKAEASPIASKVQFTGKITDRELLSAIYARAKLFLFPSLYDTNSLVQIEAASQRTPTVFLKGSVTSGTVTDNVNGFICEPTIEAFAAKVDEVCCNEELYARVSAGAYDMLYVTWDQCVSEIYDEYLRHIKNYEKKNKERDKVDK